ncbi:hypothetical protein [Marinobacter sp. DSM 26671]|jgi:hypothetical protein|nr:hypothetical protein [Marinobacter sp. DSM 26671]|tara:strand:- start:38289 stop:38669 length:381 start_codon:yes stop_codon:yes gene_type:complete
MEEMRSQLEALGLAERPMPEDKYRCADWFQLKFRLACLIHPLHRLLASASAEALPLAETPLRILACALILALGLAELSAANAPLKKIGLFFADFEAMPFSFTATHKATFSSSPAGISGSSGLVEED